MTICIVDALVLIFLIEIMTNAIFSNNWSTVRSKGYVPTESSYMYHMEY